MKSFDVEIDHQRKVVGRVASDFAARDVGCQIGKIASTKCLVQRTHRHIRRKRSKARGWRGDVFESMDFERAVCQRISPVVGITNDQLRQLFMLTEQMMF